jgi:hypothetical protein
VGLREGGVRPAEGDRRARFDELQKLTGEGVESGTNGLISLGKRTDWRIAIP